MRKAAAPIALVAALIAAFAFVLSLMPSPKCSEPIDPQTAALDSANAEPGLGCGGFPCDSGERERRRQRAAEAFQ